MQELGVCKQQKDIIMSYTNTLTLDIAYKPIGVIPVEVAVARVAQIEQAYLEAHRRKVDPRLLTPFSCQVIKSDENNVFRSAGFNGENIIEVPAPLIVATDYRPSPKKDIDFKLVTEKEQRNVSRRVVFLRDKLQCQYCKESVDTLSQAQKHLTLDHVKPQHMFKNRKAATTYDNVVTACLACNQSKGGKLPMDAKMYPRTTPKTPHYVQIKFAGKLNEPQKEYVADYFKINTEEIMF